MVEYLFDERARPHGPGMGYMDHGKAGSTVDTLAKLQHLKGQGPTGNMYQFLPQWSSVKAAPGNKTV